MNATALSSLLLLAALFFQDVQPARAAPDDLSSALQPYLNRHELAGAVALIASRDRVLSIQAMGYADIAEKKVMKRDCLFWIASMSKPIAATALMMLVEEGKVRLDDPVQKYLPHFAPRIISVTADGSHVELQKPSRDVTVRDLLRHTGGLVYRSSLETPTLDAFPLSVRIESYSLEPLIFSPGDEWSYSNAGFNTAVRIIEVVSGWNYEEFLQKKLFDPLGMKDTTFWPTDSQLTRLAKSYKSNEAGRGLEETMITALHYPLNNRSGRYTVPAGGLFSTADDLVKYCQMLLSGGIYEGRHYLSKASIEEMTRNQVADAREKGVSAPGEATGYGLGWFTSASGAFGHFGSYYTSMRIDPKRGLITIWLVQHQNFPGDGAKSWDVFQSFAEKHFSTVAVAAVLPH